jgi:hypothetical protein
MATITAVIVRIVTVIVIIVIVIVIFVIITPCDSSTCPDQGLSIWQRSAHLYNLENSAA